MKTMNPHKTVLTVAVILMAILSVSPAEATRTPITPVTPLGPYPTLPVSATTLDLTWTAADTSLFNSFLLQGPAIILVRNVHASSPFTFTLTSAPDTRGRTGDVTTYSLAAGKVSAFYLNSTAGWLQSDGYFYLAGSDVSIQFCIVRLP